MRRLAAFTIVELLVVITIIVILLALLTPALDNAIYQSELVVCAAHQRGIALSVNQYAAQNRRYYPQRNFKLQSIRLAQGDGGPADDRRLILPYMGLDLLTCPLTGKIELDEGSNDADTVVFANYGMWWNWNAPGQRGMNRIGDRWEFDVAGLRARLRVLAADHDIIEEANGNHYGTHPDDAGVTFNAVHQNGNWEAQIGGAKVTFKMTISFWRSFDISNPRGAVDRNFAYDDGSVIRFNNLRALPVGQLKMDGLPLVAVSAWAGNDSYPLERVYLPAD